jgi:type IV pilus assembly protein PilV
MAQQHIHSASMRARSERGFSLVEVMVTAIIFSIGMLGVAGLSAVSRQASFESTQRSTASELAYTLLEEMRINAGSLTDYLAVGDLGRNSRGAEPNPTCNAVGAPCTATQLVNHSIWHWEQMLDGGQEAADNVGSGGLMNPTACIDGPAGGVAGIYTVTIVWRGVRELTDAGVEACGAGSGLYGGNDEFRRMVIVRSFIDPDV